MLMMMIEEVVVFMSDGDDGGDGENEKNIKSTRSHPPNYCDDCHN